MLLVLEIKAWENYVPESKVLACKNKKKKEEAPKFDNTMDVATYLELFKAVTNRNSEDQMARVHIHGHPSNSLTWWMQSALRILDVTPRSKVRFLRRAG